MRDWPENSVLQSGDLTIRPQTGQVEIQGQLVRLGLVNMQVLLTLLEHAGEVVSRSDLFDRVWKNQTVSDDTLTRCISELRALLGKHSRQTHLIETLPKRGYRWLLPVDEKSTEVANLPALAKEVLDGRWKRVSAMALFGLSSLLLFTMLILWLVDLSLKPELVRIALIPVYASQPAQQVMAADIDDMLGEQLLATENLRFFARSSVRNDQRNAFPYLSRDMSADWIIEGKLREKQGKTRVSLSLVDARTALVIYTLTQDLDNKPIQLENLCSLFIDEVLAIVHLDDNHKN